MPAKLAYKKRLAVRAAIESGLSTRDAATVVGVSKSAAARIGADPELSPDNVQRLKDILPGMFYVQTEKCLKNITPDKFIRMNGLQLSLAAKINLQAAREAEGLPSQTVLVKRVAVNLQGDLAELRKKKERLMASLHEGGTVVDLPASSVKSVRLKRIKE